MRPDINTFNLRPACVRQSVVRSARYEHGSRAAALVSIGLILERGNAARMVNVGGKHFVTELVLQ